MNAHRLFGSCFNKPLDRLNELRIFRSFIYLAFQYFPLFAFRQWLHAYTNLFHKQYLLVSVFKPFVKEVSAD